MKTSKLITGGCLCGRVRYEITGPLIGVDHCHCSLCRRQHGAAFATYAGFNPDAFKWRTGEDQVKVYETLTGAGWCFCQACGSSLAGTEKSRITSVALGTVEGDPGIKPEAHIYVGSKAEWFEIHDNLPQFQERPPVKWKPPGKTGNQSRTTMQYIVQMSGVPGSGKSTLAEHIASEIKALVIDHDDTKSAIMSKSVAPDIAGQASYDVIKTLALKFAREGFNIVIDSPCLYPELLAFGQHIAAETGSRYCYIECRLDDLEELTRRIRNRTSKPSQNQKGPLDESPITHRNQAPKNARELFLEWAQNMQRPASYLVIDSTQPISECTQKAIDYIVNENRTAR